MNARSLTGSLLGTAVGDSIGLPYEGLSPRRAMRLFGEPERHHLVSGRGMVSDDTEHACMVAQALIESGDDVDAFTRGLGRRLRYWLLSLPAGTGLATLRAVTRLCVGVSPDRSGVFSAGNGPAMRAPILGAAVKDRELLRRFVRASTRMTHTDPKAEFGALTVALAARLACENQHVEGATFSQQLRELLADEPADELFSLVDHAVESVARGEPLSTFAASLGLSKGVSGYVYHTVPVAIHAWLSHQQDYRRAIMEVVSCGGDTDSTAAIVGGIVGCSVGKEGIPDEWLGGLMEWPRTIAWMERLAEQLHEARTSGQRVKALRLSPFGTLARNLFFLCVVLLHGFRRLLPPF